MNGFITRLHLKCACAIESYNRLRRLPINGQPQSLKVLQVRANGQMHCIINRMLIVCAHNIV